MGPHYLNKLFKPSSIAVFGASERPDSVGARVFANLIIAGFGGELYPVNPKYEQLQGRTCYPDITAISKPVELAVIATPAATVPGIIQLCGEHGVHAVVVLSSGFGEADGKGQRLQREMVEHAQGYGMRIVGPNCLGIMHPRIGLNATFSKNQAATGNVALVSQSGAICTAILDWAEARGIGFSAMVSLGDAADVDFGDILDYLALDPETHSILLYVEGIKQARGFMSGLRAAARMKPVIVLKVGRHQAGSRAAMSHTGALVGMDDVFDAALSRAGVVRAFTIEQLFSAAQILSAGYHRVQGNHLTIVTNGGGPGVIATDRASELGVAISEPSPEMVRRLDEVLPAHWSRNNPVDILGDATPQRYRDAVEACLQDDNSDGVLAMLTPQAMTDPSGCAEAVVAVADQSEKPVLACWMGDKQVAAAWELFANHRRPHFDTPEAAVEAFSYLSSYHRNQQLLLQMPGPLSYNAAPDVEGARLIIEEALAEGRTNLTSMEAKAVLIAFGIPVARTVAVHNANEALIAAESMGFPVAMKIDSPEITHKSDVGGVRLNIGSARAVRHHYNELVESVLRQRPEATIRGVTIEQMYKTANGRELMLGVLRDPVFGPVISFAAGGTAVEVMGDRAVALPPLNSFIVRRMIEQTRVAKLLGAFRQMPPVNMDALENVLLRVSDLVCELPQIQEMDINPLIVDEHGALAVDARFAVAHRSPSLVRYSHMAIHPYPSELEISIQLADGTDIIIRPIRPEDAGIEEAFVNNLSSQSKYFRFMQSLQKLTPQMMVRFTQIDYEREMALIAVHASNGRETEIGVARYTLNPDGRSCEFALVVADAWQKRGIGTRLMNELMKIAKDRGVNTLEAEILGDNHGMLALVRDLGFSLRSREDDPAIKIAMKAL